MCELCAIVGYDIHNDGFQINTTSAGNQTGPNVVRFPDGRFIVLYQSSDTPGNGIDIRGRIFDANGIAAGNDFLVNQTTAGDQTTPALFVNSNGTLSLLWQTPDLALAGNTQLVERTFDLFGNPLGGEQQVSGTGADGAYSFAQRSNGTIFITYENNGDIYGRTLNANWIPLTAEVQLNTTTAGTQIQSRLVTLANGNILVAFQSNDNADGGGGTGNLIRNRVFSASGDAWTPVSINGSTNDFVVNTTGAGDQTSERLSRLFDGRILEVWQSDDTGDGSGGAIRARIISATGDPTGAAADFIVETTTTGNQLRPAILAFDDGRRLIYWHSFESATDTIRGRFVHANGSLDASDFVIANLADTTVPTFSLFLLANQQVEFNYQGVSSSDGLGAGIQGAIGSAANLSLNTPFFNTGTSPFDLPLASFSLDQAAAQIGRGNAPWNDVFGSPESFTYSYRATSTGVSYSNGASGFTQFNAAEIAAAEAAIQLWEDVANITLTRVQDAGSQYSDSGRFLLWNYASSAAGSQAANAAGFGGATFNGSSWQHFVYLNDDRDFVTAPTFTNDGFRLILHEIGHALGLSHPGNYNVLPGGGDIAYDGNAVYRQDTDQYTVMTYFDESISHANFVDTFAMTPLLHDIAAIQRLYGVNSTTRAGDTTYGFNSNAGRDSYAITSSSQHAVFAVWDGGGNDTLDFSGYNARQIITLVPEQFSSVGGLEFNVAIARATIIENAIGGTSDDFMIGNAANNTLSGGAGNDTIDGGAGADALIGGPGDDTYGVDAGDAVTENPGEGTDTILTTLSSFVLGANIENLIFADGATHTGFGNALANVMTGGSGSDTLVAHTVAGLFAQEHDTLSGGDGNDTLYGEAADTLNGGAGFDVLQVINDFAMNLDLVATGIEYVVSGFGNDTYTAAAATTTIEVYGGGGNDQITSGSGNDNLWAGVGNDTLVANDGNDLLVGDLGADSLSGGPGSDRLYVDSSDTFIDGGTGFDAAYIATGAGTSLNLAASSLEWVADFAGGNDTIDGSGSSANLEIYAAGGTDIVTGGSGADFVWGEAGNDTLTGNGGNDTLVGGTGSDRITGGTGTDALYGNSGNGGDTVLDTFVFGDNWGTDFVFDFEHGVDKIDMTAVSGLNDFSQLTLTNTSSGHCYVSFGGNLIALAGMAGQITQGDFLL